MFYLSLFIACSLFLTGCSDSTSSSEQSNKGNPKKLQPIINPEQKGCRRCHIVVQDKPHDFPCSTCHAGKESSTDKKDAHSGLISQPTHPTSMAQSCSRCHPDQVAGTAQSIHFTLKGEVNLVRKSFGAQKELDTLTQIPISDAPETALQLADDLLRRRCLRCHPYSSGDPYPLVGHGTGCASCHMDFSKGSPTSHTFLATPSDKQCLQCHYGNWVGADYHGRFEHDFNEEYRTPYITKDPFTRPYGVEYHQLTPDIHQQRGLICVDCHNGAELMNSRKTKVIQCQDCHLQENLVKSLPANVTEDEGKFILHSKGDKKTHAIPLMRDPAHTAFKDQISCQACHAQWAFNDTGTHLLRNDTRENDAFWRLTTQGSWEVEKILTYNLNPDYPTTLAPVMLDKITGEEKKGIWHQGYIMRRWETVQLDRDKSGRISVMRPVLDLHLSWLDEENKIRFDAIQAQSSDKGLQPYTPHTTGPAGMFYRQRLQDFYRLEEKKKEATERKQQGQQQEN
ncbi:MAG: cytochrome c3 family protein [Proteobacteria bacterium]|nr:cytochrome c3 family protein [Pseudomonadota bacterium]MBU1648027.1 cytochrome c3 family protein [Pseudomonadota bacterium]